MRVAHCTAFAFEFQGERRVEWGVRWQWAVLLGAAAGAIIVPAAAPGQVRPSCAQVMSEVHRNIHQRQGRSPGAAAVAKKLHTDAAWVERCMRSYGRIPADGFRTTDAVREQLEAAVEEGEPFYQEPDAPDAQPRPRWEREKRLHPRIEPTPDPFVNEFGEVRER